jgi:hypothetical protein
MRRGRLVVHYPGFFGAVVLATDNAVDRSPEHSRDTILTLAAERFDWFCNRTRDGGPVNDFDLAVAHFQLEQLAAKYDCTSSDQCDAAFASQALMVKAMEKLPRETRTGRFRWNASDIARLRSSFDLTQQDVFALRSKFRAMNIRSVAQHPRHMWADLLDELGLEGTIIHTLGQVTHPRLFFAHAAIRRLNTLLIAKYGEPS